MLLAPWTLLRYPFKRAKITRQNAKIKSLTADGRIGTDLEDNCFWKCP